MQADEIAEIVANLRTLGADIADIEVKRAQSGLPKSVRETLSAFSNSHGGVIILGLDETDAFAATGLAHPAKLAADLGAMCAEDMEPPVRPLIEIHSFEGTQIVVAHVPELDPAHKPCFVKTAGITKGSYTRVSDGDRRLTTYEVQLLLSSRGQPRDDEEPVPGTGLDSIDPVSADALVARLRITRPYAFQGLTREAILRRAKVLVPHGTTEAVSVAGLLTLNSFPQEFFPQLMVTFVSYPTVTGSPTPSGERFLDNVTFEGPIPVLIRDALNAVRRNMSRRALIVGVGRQDVWEYPETALREAITNALVHRDLSGSARGTAIRIEMYPDRLVISNPGGLYGSLTVDDLGEEGVSSARNAALIRLLEDVPLPGETRTICENRGSGIRAMLDALRAAGMSPPRFDDKISRFTVTFPNHTLLGPDTIQWISSLGAKGLTSSQHLFLAVLRDAQDALDNRAYREHTGVDSRVATAELQDLVARELITQAGTRRWARYELAPQRTPPTAERADRRKTILDALGSDTLSRAELAARTDLADQIVRRWLRVLRDEGTIEHIGNPRSPNVKYRRAAQGTLFEPDNSS
ncbi:ATP-binding protein [Nonomuraea sp. 10N515B]|uniref:ATP-binding protein n=1 Tax=Nonomuraea sp. 10N515B TaxID=3457422 RepID=UPI003FCC5041